VPFGTGRSVLLAYLYASMTADNGVARIAPRVRIAMKIILSALVALSVLASIAGPAAAADARTFFEQLDRQAGG
jgi:hypothetical protein